MLKLALPNGSLEKKTVALFAAAGWSIKREGRKALCETDCPFVETVFFTRPQAIPRIVASGICDVGICGRDCVIEEQNKHSPHLIVHRADVLIELATLPYSKETNGQTVVALCTQKRNRRKAREIPPGSIVYSEYPNITRNFFEIILGIRDVHIIHSPGSTEGHIAIGEYVYGVCIVEQGKTLAANNLRVIEELTSSRTIIIGRKDGADHVRKFTEELLNASQKENVP